MGEPFFVTKERFPHSPSKKVILDIAFFVYKHLYASGMLENTLLKKDSLRPKNGSTIVV